MAATNIGALLIAAALLAKSGLFGDLLPGAQKCPEGFTWDDNEKRCKPGAFGL
jgi:hypothetical protein